jgi:hypothetical protein
MRVVVEAAQEVLQRLMHHRVMGDFVVERGEFGLRGQFAVHQQVGHLEEAGLLGQLLDRVAAIQQHAGLAIDVGDGGLAGRGRGEARVVREETGLPGQLRNVDAIVAERGFEYRHGHRLVAGGQRGLVEF